MVVLYVFEKALCKKRVLISKKQHHPKKDLSKRNMVYSNYIKNKILKPIFFTKARFIAFSLLIVLVKKIIIIFAINQSKIRIL